MNNTAIQPITSSNADDKCIAVCQFLEEFFHLLDLKDINYTILRNYDGLPGRPGRDIDILTDNFAELTRELLRAAQQAGFHYRVFRKYDALVKYHFVRWLPSKLIIVEIDCLWAIRWKGIDLVPHTLLDNRQKFKSFYILRPGAEAAISLIKHLIYTGKVQDKYKPILPDLARRDQERFRLTLRQSFGPQLTDELLEFTCHGNWRRIENLVPNLRKAAILRGISKNALTQLGHWTEYIWRNLMKFFRHSGLFVVLIGPDGSGKSTITKGLEQFLQPLFQGTKCFHFKFGIIPRLRDLLGAFGFNKRQKNTIAEVSPEISQDNVAKLSPLKSLCYLLYYSLDYFLGHMIIFWARSHGKLIIFDRYIYDYMIQSAMSLPWWLMRMVMRILPKPDAVFFLRNDPEVIFSRKPELSREELSRQIKACSQLISILPNGYVVETTGSPQDITALIAKLLTDEMFNND